MYQPNVSAREPDTPHWTDDDLIAQIYGVGPENNHLSYCVSCQSRLAALQLHQRNALPDEEIAPERLAAQRRRVYEAIARPIHWWNAISFHRWAPAGAAGFALAASLFYYGEQQHLRSVRDNAISDAQLAQDVSNLSDNVETAPTAPLQDLFVE